MTAIAPNYSQNRSHRAMTRIPAAAKFTLAAARVYFANNTFSDKFGQVVRFFDRADKFVPDRAAKTGIAANYLKIGIANTGRKDTHQSFIVPLRAGHILEGENASFRPQSFHIRTPRPNAVCSQVLQAKDNTKYLKFTFTRPLSILFQLGQI